MTGPQKKTDDARQAETGHGARYVLGISTALAAVLLVAVAWAYFGPPDGGFGQDNGPQSQIEQEHNNPPYGMNKQDPDTQTLPSDSGKTAAPDIPQSDETSAP